MSQTRVMFFVDGFNLYHALKDLDARYLTYVDLNKLLLNFAPSPQHSIEAIYYFSAYTEWDSSAVERHKNYIKALQSTGVVEPIMGKFKNKKHKCKKCDHVWKSHEEKQTDVNIAWHIFDCAHRGKFDRAVLVSADSDFAGAIRNTRKRFPEKQFRILTPVNKEHTYDLVEAVGGEQYASHIKKIHVERSLFPKIITLPSGEKIVRYPLYDPPKKNT